MKFSILNDKIVMNMSDSSFLNDNKTVMLSNLDNNRLQGFQTSKSKEKSIVASIGEYIERQYLIEQNKYAGDFDVQAFSLLNKNEVSIKSSDVKKKYILIDSLGMATHKTSKECIKNALSEFIERQSFIFNYLSKKCGQSIDINRFGYTNTNDYFKNIKFYNISLIKEYYVVIGKGMIEDKFCIGLGSSNSMREAINKCMNEIKQCKIPVGKSEKKNLYIREKKLNYIDYFLAIEPTRLDNAYKYLDLGSNIIESSEDYLDFDLEKIISSLWYNCKMNPLITVYNTRKSKINIKAIHIFDLNWFPSMMVYRYCEDNYRYIEEVMDCKLDRNCNFIPIA